MDERVIAALIGATVVALGWFFTYWREQSRSRRLRREKVTDIQKAIRAEIKALVQAPQNQDLQGSLDRGMARFDLETDDNPYVPFIPHEKHDTVYQALVSEIHLLPTQTVEPVILYYNQTVAIAHMASDLRSERYAALSRDKRSALLRRYMEMKIEANRMGRRAVRALSNHIARQSAGGNVNKTGQVRSDP